MELEIGIVGGGVAGLTFAAHCEKFGIPYTLFIMENDDSGGYGLTIQDGRKVLDFLDISFLPSEKNELRRFVRIDSSLNIVSQTRHSNGNYVVPRTVLINKLKEKVSHCNIIQMKVINSLIINELNTVITVDGTSYQFDYLVGADGINSQIRELMGINKKDCIEDTGYLLRIYQFDENSKLKNIQGDVIEYISDGVDRIRIFIKPCGMYGASAQIFFHSQKKDVIENYIPDAIKSELLLDYWYETKLCTSKEFDQKYSSRIILLGDSFNAMIPYKGNGANTAINNAHKLSLIIKENYKCDIVDKYYSAIINKSIKMVNASYKKFKDIHLSTVPILLSPHFAQCDPVKYYPDQ